MFLPKTTETDINANNLEMSFMSWRWTNLVGHIENNVNMTMTAITLNRLDAF